MATWQDVITAAQTLLQRWKRDVDFTSQIVNGPATGPTSVVNTDGGTIPTFAKTLGDAAAESQSLRSDLASAADPAKGAALVGWLQSGTGAAGRTVRNKLRDVVTLEDFGGVGDWNGTTGADNATAFTAALAAHSAVRITKGSRFRCASTVTVPADKTIINDGGEIVFTTGGLWLNSGVVCHDVFISGNGRTNAGSGFRLLAGANGVRLINPKVRDVHYNAVDNANNGLDLRIINPDFSNIGGAGINVTFQGCGYYGGAGGLLISGGGIDNTYGQAGVFINGGNGWSVRGVYIHDTFYRGIQAFGNPTGGLISGNQIKRTGSINNTGSGVGCNGIFCPVANYNDLLVIGNEIEDVAENGIEGSGTFLSNKITRTGYRSLTTPSKEGIYVDTSAICHNNIITDSAADGIKTFSTISGQYADVCDNIIRNPALSGILLQVDGAGVTFGYLNVDRNIVYGANDATKNGINILRSNNAVFDAPKSYVRDNIVHGRSTNFVSTFIGNVSDNSFDPTTVSFGDVTGTADKARRVTMIFNTPLTAARDANANTTNPAKGDITHVVRTAAATGAFTLSFKGSGGAAIKGLSAAGQWAEAEYDGSAWVLTGFGTL